MKKIQLLCLLALLIVSLSNCKKDGPAGPTGSTGSQGAVGPLLTGNLQGYVSLWDQYGSRILTGQAGDTVTLVGTANRVYTDSTGFYKFSGLTTGVYSIAVNKTGFGNTMVQNIQFAGGGNTIANAKLSQPSTTVVPALTDSIGPATGNITFYTTLTTTCPQSRSFILYVGTSPSVSANPATYLIYYTKAVNPTPVANALKLAFTIPTTDLYDAGFTSGSTAYVAAYGIGSTLTASAFVDYTNQARTVFTALSMPPALSNVTVP